MRIDNLSSRLKEPLPAEACEIILFASHLAQEKQQRLYLAGGAVRDILMEQPFSDIDLALEGDAVSLAKTLAQTSGSKVELHTAFNTAKLIYPSFQIDIAGTRSESYPYAGALPNVKPADIFVDLSRRDFSINAMAVSLNKVDYGDLIDQHDGQTDLKRKLVRTLHPRSFQDDPTRMWRAVRYEQRLSFQIEPDTLSYIQRDWAALRNISHERQWYEMECALNESLPEKVLFRAEDLNLLDALHPPLVVSKSLSTWYAQARQQSLPKKPSLELYLALFLYPFGKAACQEFVKNLKLNRSLSKTILDNARIKGSIRHLSNHSQLKSSLYHTLSKYDPTAIKANIIATSSKTARDNLLLFFDCLRYVKPILSGQDLLTMGFEPGPTIAKTINQLLVARLDGKISTREEEITLAKQVGRL
ncbi:MAG: hypothetical protein FWH42_00295 [Dehalococcoidia bacterium]|nr:hypothetical protein [Dehalococcoidia bacterium]